MFEFLYVGYTHNYLVFAGLTSLTIFINYYMSNKKLQELILSIRNENVVGKENEKGFFCCCVVLLPSLLLYFIPSLILSYFYFMKYDTIYDHGWYEVGGE